MAPPPRPPMPSITREVSTSEMKPLVDATRREEHDTASLGGAELDALLEPERKGSARVAVPPTHVPAAPVPAQLSEPTVVIAPGLQAPPEPPARDRVSLPTMVLPAGMASAPPLDPPHDPRDRVSQPTAILASEIFPTPPRAPQASAPPVAAWGSASPAPEPPRSSPRRAQGPHAVSDEPDWATRTHLPVSRETARTARKTSTILLISAASSLAVIALVSALLLTRGGQSTSNAATAETGGTSAPSTETAAPPSQPTAAPSGSSNVPLPASATAATPNTPEAEARAALTRLREGMKACVRDVIGVLPGTSPAVPDRMARMRKGSFKSHPRDYASPVFSCAKYRETDAQRFQIQWQITQQPGEGRGVAWLDDDGDGKADRALSFRAALVRKNEVDLGDIGFLTPVPPVMKPRP